MNKHSNIGTIIRKEFARFFGDRAMVFTTVIMPGLILYLSYTLIGGFMQDKIQEEVAAAQTEYVSPLSPEEEALLDSLQTVRAAAIAEAQEDAQDDRQDIGDILSTIIPMLVIMLIASGCMAVTTAAIAGEKERGTIATLLVTPMKRWELAVGKLVSLSFFALLSGISSFLGIILSLPKMLQADQLDLDLGGSLYTTSDYLMLLLVIISTVLVIISVISIISAWAKSVRAAGSMAAPLMIFFMLASFSTMMGDPSSSALYLIPVYNSAQSMAAILAFKAQWLPLLVTIGSNVLFTSVSVFVLAKMFNSEKVMFSR